MPHAHHLKKPHQGPFDVLLYFFVFATPLFEIPQALSIYSRQSAEGVPLVTWAFFFCSSLTWLVYGLRRKIRPIILAYSLYLVIEATIVAGLLKYS